MRIETAEWNTVHVGDGGDVVLLQQANEFVERVVGVANGEQRGLRGVGGR